MKKKRKIWAWCIAIIVGVAAIAVAGVLEYKALELRRYPLDYTETLIKYADEYALDRYLVAAVINAESAYKSDAVSNKGAVGLMQIMPDTGAWIGEKLDMKDYEESRLFEPEVNIRFGCWYLNFLSERCDGNVTLILASYNAGNGNVRKWLADTNYSKDGKNLDVIPFPETENYVKKVMRAYEKYRELSEKELG